MIALLSAGPAGAHPEAGFERGRLRIDASVAEVFDSDGWRDDRLLTLSVEWEFQVIGPLSMGMRILPLFAYGGNERVYGFASGPANRLYSNPDTQTGFYGGIGVALVWHSPRFDGNASAGNFFHEVTLGYRFEDIPLSLAVKVHHLSNAGIADPNHGWNAVAFEVGSSWSPYGP